MSFAPVVPAAFDCPTPVALNLQISAPLTVIATDPGMPESGVPTVWIPPTGDPLISMPVMVDEEDDEEDLDDSGHGFEDEEDTGFNDGLDDDDGLDEFDDIEEDDFDDDFDDDFEEELDDDYEIEIDDEISDEFGLSTGKNDTDTDAVELDDFEDFDSI